VRLTSQRPDGSEQHGPIARRLDAGAAACEDHRDRGFVREIVDEAPRQIPDERRPFLPDVSIVDDQNDHSLGRGRRVVRNVRLDVSEWSGSRPIPGVADLAERVNSLSPLAVDNREVVLGKTANRPAFGIDHADVDLNELDVGSEARPRRLLFGRGRQESGHEGQASDEGGDRQRAHGVVRSMRIMPR
jgi:hypothetical protein